MTNYSAKETAGTKDEKFKISVWNGCLDYFIVVKRSLKYLSEMGAWITL